MKPEHESSFSLDGIAVFYSNRLHGSTTSQIVHQNGCCALSEYVKTWAKTDTNTRMTKQLFSDINLKCPALIRKREKTLPK